MENAVESKKILLVRLSAIGDIVFASTILKPFKSASESYKIYWLVKSIYSPLLKGNKFIDEVIELPINEWQLLVKKGRFLKLIGSIFNFIKLLRSYNFDIAIDLHGLLKSTLWVFLSGAKNKIGLGKKEGNWILLDEIYNRDGEKSLFGSEYLYLAQRLNLPIDRGEPNIFIKDEILNDAKSLLESKGVGIKFLVVAPFTTRPQKHWFDEYWVELFKKLTGSFDDLYVVILGGGNDKIKAEKFLLNARIKNFAGITDLHKSAALISLSCGIIGVDTGMTHLGTAFDKDTIAIFGSTVPYLKTHSDNTIVLYHKLPCSPCKRHPTCDGRYDCMKAITPETVFNTVVNKFSFIGAKK